MLADSVVTVQHTVDLDRYLFPIVSGGVLHLVDIVTFTPVAFQACAVFIYRVYSILSSSTLFTGPAGIVLITPAVSALLQSSKATKVFFTWAVFKLSPLSFFLQNML